MKPSNLKKFESKRNALDERLMKAAQYAESKGDAWNAWALLRVRSSIQTAFELVAVCGSDKVGEAMRQMLEIAHKQLIDAADAPESNIDASVLPVACRIVNELIELDELSIERDMRMQNVPHPADYWHCSYWHRSNHLGTDL